MAEPRGSRQWLPCKVFSSCCVFNVVSKEPLLAGLGAGELGSEGQHMNAGTCRLELWLAALRVKEELTP